MFHSVCSYLLPHQILDTILNSIDSFLSQQIAYNVNCWRHSTFCSAPRRARWLLYAVSTFCSASRRARWLLYVLYTAELSRVVAGHGLSLRQYADDSQVYVSATVDDAAAAVDQLSIFLVDVETWLKASRLRLNPVKTQVM